MTTDADIKRVYAAYNDGSDQDLRDALDAIPHPTVEWIQHGAHGRTPPHHVQGKGAVIDLIVNLKNLPTTVDFYGVEIVDAGGLTLDRMDRGKPHDHVCSDRFELDAQSGQVIKIEHCAAEVP